MDTVKVIAIAGVVGAVLSVLTSLLKRWVVLSRFWNYVMAFVITIFAVMLWDILENGWEGWTLDFASRIAFTFTATQLVYGLVIKQLGWDDVLEGVTIDRLEGAPSETKMEKK